MRKNISNNNIEAETVRVRSMEEGSLQLSYPAQLIIHGESIGGMASAYSARMLCSETTGDTPPFEVLLICDRTFSNLIAVARRMVGDWTKIIIPYLVPDWCTDVAADYMSAACKKVGKTLVTCKAMNHVLNTIHGILIVQLHRIQGTIR